MIDSDSIESYVNSAEGTSEFNFDGKKTLLACSVIVAANEKGFVLLLIVGSIADVAVALK